MFYNLNMITEQKEKTLEFSKSIINSLTKIVGKDCIITDPEGLYAYSFDCAHIKNNDESPKVVVFPKSTQEVSSIVKIANENEIPIIPRGASTNHAGGCAPVHGGIIIHFSKMNKIIEISNENLTCRVQPGVVVGELQKKVLADGLFFPPDPSNLAVSTIGGGIALSSGGPRAFKYGTFKDYVIDLEVVLADGTVMHTGSNTVKNVTGYNLSQLFVGSEGTLGIITEATLRLIPKPQSSKVMLAYFDEIKNATKAVNTVILKRIVPAVIDIMDKNTINSIEDFFPTGLDRTAQAALLIELDGNLYDVEEQQKTICDIFSNFNVSSIKSAKNQEEANNLWKARRS